MKTHPSPLLRLTPEDRDQLLAWCDQHSYADVLTQAALPRAKGGLDLHTSPAALCRFYTRCHRQARAAEALAQAARALQVRQVEDPWLLPHGILALLEQNVFRVMQDPEAAFHQYLPGISRLIQLRRLLGHKASANALHESPNLARHWEFFHTQPTGPELHADPDFEPLKPATKPTAAPATASPPPSPAPAEATPSQPPAPELPADLAAATAAAYAQIIRLTPEDHLATAESPLASDPSHPPTPPDSTPTPAENLRNSAHSTDSTTPPSTPAASPTHQAPKPAPKTKHYQPQNRPFYAGALKRR